MQYILFKILAFFYLPNNNNNNNNTYFYFPVYVFSYFIYIII